MQSSFRGLKLLAGDLNPLRVYLQVRAFALAFPEPGNEGNHCVGVRLTPYKNLFLIPIEAIFCTGSSPPREMVGNR